MFEIKIQTAHQPPKIPNYYFTGEIRIPEVGEYFIPLHRLLQDCKTLLPGLIKKTDEESYLLTPSLIYELKPSIDFDKMYYKIFDVSYNELCKISVCEVYGKTSKELNLSIPSNYKVIDFRIPRENDIILSIDLYAINISNEKKFDPNSRKIISIAPRLILKDLKER